MANFSDENTPHPRLTFLGAAGTVTGSKHLVTTSKSRLLLDCGLFQGLKNLRERNWSTPAFDARALDAVVLSHAHLDHCGYLPLIVKKGFSGPVFCTPATAALVAIVLRDAAHLQEEDAARANRHGYSKHRPALPLFTRDDAERAIALLQPRGYGTPFKASSDAEVIYRHAGHILGSATVDVQLPRTKLVFSGDLGRWGRPIIRDPEPVPAADVLLVESTYGDRTHVDDVEATLVRVITEAVERRGVIIVPAFAIGRTQELIWTLRKLEDAKRIPSLPVYVDSPMAIDVTQLYCKFPQEHDLDMKLLMDEKRCPLCCQQYKLVRTPVESKALNDLAGPMIIIAGSGMATGGRVLHHLERRVSDERTTVLLVGFQAAGTRGRLLQNGAQVLRFHGAEHRVLARVETLHGLSAHADQSEILRWLRMFERAPARTYVVHGEPAAAMALAREISRQLGWRADVAGDAESVPLTETEGDR